MRIISDTEQQSASAARLCTANICKIQCIYDASVNFPVNMADVLKPNGSKTKIYFMLFMHICCFVHI